MTYSEKLKDPRWQRKRLEILQRDGWKCVVTGLSNQTLHVHHKRYFGNPWDCPDEELETICEPVHSIISPCASVIRRELPGFSVGAKTVFNAMCKTLDDHPDEWSMSLFHLRVQLVILKQLCDQETQSHTQRSRTVQEMSETKD